MTQSVESPRVPWKATALSLLSAGVGHVYCGRIYQGLLFYFAWFLLPALCFLASLAAPSTSLLMLCILLPVAGVLAVYVYAAFDAFWLARKAQQGYRLKDYNRPGVYLLLVVVYLICPISLVAAVRQFAYEAFYIPSASMSPSIVSGDRVLVNKMRPRRSYPARGSLIVFRNPESDGGFAFVKRVVAVAGDRVVIRGDEVSINGRTLTRDPLPLDALGPLGRDIEGEAYMEENAGSRYKVLVTDTDPGADVDVVVPERSVFVLGDNRNISRDSRHFGSIHLGDVIGYVDYIYYPATDWSRFGVCDE